MTKDLKAAAFPGLYHGGPDPPRARGLFKQLWKTAVPSHPTWGDLSTYQWLRHPGLASSSRDTLLQTALAEGCSPNGDRSPGSLARLEAEQKLPPEPTEHPGEASCGSQVRLTLCL